jgi:hypothetical protein
MKKYYPYKSDKDGKKYYIITKDDKEDWTKSGIDTPGFWAYHYLWSLPSKTQSYQKIKQTYL